MSTCVSMNGEFDNHTLDDDFICGLCFALDEDALIDERDDLRDELKRLRVGVQGVRETYSHHLRHAGLPEVGDALDALLAEFATPTHDGTDGREGAA